MKKKWPYFLVGALLFAGVAGSILVLRQPEGRLVEIVQDGEVLYRLDLAAQSRLDIAQVYRQRFDVELLCHSQGIFHIFAEIPAGLARHGDAHCVLTGQLAQNAHQGAVFAAAVAVDDAVAMGIFQGELDECHPLFEFLFVVSHDLFHPFLTAGAALPRPRNHAITLQ